MGKMRKLRKNKKKSGDRMGGTNSDDPMENRRFWKEPQERVKVHGCPDDPITRFLSVVGYDPGTQEETPE
jgi:hypothetical protein